MSISLYEHNQTAFNAVLAMLHTYGKAAVVHPTGTGKSYIGFKLCERFPQKNICWLSPSEYIFKTQLENLKADTAGWQPENVKFFTYAKLMLMNETDLLKIQPDYIILDEFHRCGAEMWGKGVSRLLMLYHNVPVLGLSATAIRYLDNQRNMANELFEGNIASEMTLGEAIVRGILQPPKYVLSVFSYQDDFARLQYRVKCAKAKATRDRAEKYLEALRRALENADGLDVVFEKHVPDKSGKYLVFCSNIEHLQEMQGKVNEWFGGIDAHPHIYTAYSEDTATAVEFERFKNDNSKHLKLLFAIDMLNEGIHIDNVSGIILLRPTVSPIIYKQQIGRALAAGKSRIPVIFDIVNNIENLYSIGTIQEEMQVAISYYRSLGLDSYIVNDRFDVTDEIREAKELFQQLNETLSASWDIMYLYAKEYYRTYGHLNIPTSYKTLQGYSLGVWLMTQRRIYSGAANGVLNEERIEKLEKIGMVWDSRNDLSWKRHFAAAKQYFDVHGNLRVPASYVTPDGVHLGSWLSNLKSYKKNNAQQAYLTKERIKMLDEIGMVWNGFDFLWQQNLAAAAAYYKRYGNLDVPVGYVSENGVRLYAWLTKIRMSYQSQKRGKNGPVHLDDGQIEALEGLGMEWRTRSELQWDKAYEAAKEYFKDYGDLNVPIRYKTKTGFGLGVWVNNQRKNHEKGRLGEEQIVRLNKLHMSWIKSSKAYSWDEMFSLAKRYYTEHGNLVVPCDYRINGIWLERWVSAQRVSCRKHTLSASRQKKLEEIGMFWGSRAEREWFEQYNDAKQYYLKNGNLNIPKEYVASSGKKTKYWLDRQAIKYNKGILNGKQLELLKLIGWHFHQK